MQQFINDIVQTQVQSHLREMEKKNNDGIKLDGKRDDTGKLTTGKKVNKGDGRDLICKSPSDTTIYRPALRKGVAESNEIINKIAHFVEGIRIGTSKHSTLTTSTGKRRDSDQDDDNHIHHRSRDRSRTPRRDRQDRQETTPDKEVTERTLIDAEQFKAKLQVPKGKSFDFEKFLHNLDDDDEFFHVSCHIKSGLRTKIARGEFIDLEKLLPKDKGGVEAILLQLMKVK